MFRLHADTHPPHTNPTEPKKVISELLDLMAHLINVLLKQQQSQQGTDSALNAAEVF